MTIRVAAGPKELDVMDWMTRAGLELIGQAGLGYSFGALDDVEAKENRCATALKNLM